MGFLSREFEVLATALVLFVFYPPPSIFLSVMLIGKCVHLMSMTGLMLMVSFSLFMNNNKINNNNNDNK